MPQITVATLNLKNGDLRWGERAPLLVQQLVGLRPDIIGFQEIAVPLDQGNWLCRRVNDLSWSDGTSRTYTLYHMAAPRENVSLEALGILTHLPVVAHEGFDYLIRNRVAHRLRVEVDGRPLDFYNTHFHHVADAPGNELRQQQSQQLLAWIAERSGGVPTVLVGDFNAPPSAAPIRILKERLRSAYEALRGVEPDGTFPSPLMIGGTLEPVTIDYIFVSYGIEVVEAFRVFDQPDPDDASLYASDHYGLMARLELS